jgi:hypothetical protein
MYLPHTLHVSLSNLKISLRSPTGSGGKIDLEKERKAREVSDRIKAAALTGDASGMKFTLEDDDGNVVTKTEYMSKEEMVKFEKPKRKKKKDNKRRTVAEELMVKV